MEHGKKSTWKPPHWWRYPRVWITITRWTCDSKYLSEFQGLIPPLGPLGLPIWILFLITLTYAGFSATFPPYQRISPPSFMVVLIWTHFLTNNTSGVTTLVLRQLPCNLTFLLASPPKGTWPRASTSANKWTAFMLSWLQGRKQSCFTLSHSH